MGSNQMMIWEYSNFVNMEIKSKTNLEKVQNLEKNTEIFLDSFLP